MIYVLLKGGLGNQLFQYKYGKMLSLKFNDDVCYCIEKNRCGNCLNKVGIEAKIVESKKMNFYASRKNYFVKALKKFFPRIAFFCLKIFGVYYWDSPKKIELKLSKRKKDKYVIGYWQFNDMYKNTDVEISFDTTVHERVESYLSKIDDNSCFVHVRRGDYVKHKYLYVCDKDYYEKSMNKMISLNKNTRFFILSNDIMWCKNNIVGFDCEYVDDLNDDVCEFYLMSLFKNAIISNSTFSYCAINTGDYPKNVVAPKIWRTGKKSKYRDIYDERWHLE